MSKGREREILQKKTARSGRKAGGRHKIVIMRVARRNDVIYLIIFNQKNILLLILFYKQDTNQGT